MSADSKVEIQNNNKYAIPLYYTNPIDIERSELVSECRKYNVNPNALLSFIENENYVEIEEHLKEELQEKQKEIKDEIDEQAKIHQTVKEHLEQTVKAFKEKAAQCKAKMESLHSQFVSICENCNGNIANLSADDKKIYNSYISAKKLSNYNGIMESSTRLSLLNAIYDCGKWALMQVQARK